MPDVSLAASLVVCHFHDRGPIKWLVNAFESHYPSRGSAPEELTETFRKQGFLTKKQACGLVTWKLGARRAPQFAKKNSPRDIRKMSRELAFQIDLVSPGEAVAIACRLKQVKVTTASAFLAAWSDRFPIIDARACDALRSISRTVFAPAFPVSKSLTYDAYDFYVQTLQLAAARLGVTSRQIDVALYMTGRL